MGSKEARWNLTLTLREAAESLGVSPITLRLQVRNGKLAAEKRGRDWFVSQREVERYRVENKREVSR
jgi:excisionase family DNA binding protein